MAKTKKKNDQVPAKAGRPRAVDDEKAVEICKIISTSNKSLRTICKELKISVESVIKLLRDDEKFALLYTRAKEDQADYLAEEIIEIADDSSNDTIMGEYGPVENKEWTSRSKLRVEARKWVAAKLKPHKYSEKLDLNHSGELAIKQITGMEIK